MVYSYDEVFEATMKYFNGDEMASNTWIKKYCLQNENGEYLEKTPEDMHHRLAKAFFEVENGYISSDNTKNKKMKLSEYGYNRNELTEEDIFNYFDKFKYVIPAGSVMSGLGGFLPVSYSNCWVIDGPNDSLEDIFRVCNEQSQLMKRRGGVGFDISKLRPYKSKVNNSAKTSTGAASFMDLFSHVTNTIAQMGRRGALMISIDIVHPDSEFFIEKKQDLTKVTGANISVKITDKFMDCVKSDSDFYQVWPIEKYDYITDKFENTEDDSKPEYDVLTNCESGVYCKRIKAKKLWDKLIHCAWNTGEPGILFEDKHFNYSPDSVYKELKGTSSNPCGEIFMHEDSCRLMNLNISSYVENPYTKDAFFDYEKFYKHVYEAMRLSDDLVDLEKNAILRILNKIEKDGDKGNSEYNLYQRLLNNSLNGRRCGLGFTALSDAIAMLGMKYDSDESLKTIEHIMRVKFIAEVDCQIDMAITRGAFPLYNKENELNGNEWYARFKSEMPDLYKRFMTYGHRNASWSTCPPAGTVSLMAQTSSGIEPVFMPIYTRRVKCMKPTDRVDYVDNVGEKFTEYLTVHPGLKKWAIVNYGEGCNEWNSDKWAEIYKLSPWYGSTANEIEWKRRIELQSIVQKYTTHSISSTLNLPNSATESEVNEIYFNAWEDNLKGVTVYRDGCRSGVMVSVNKEDSKKGTMANTAKRRPKSLKCKIFRFVNKGDKWVSVVGMMDNEPYEIFTGLQERLNIPTWVTEGSIVKNYEDITDENGVQVKKSRYDICYTDKDGYQTCVQGLSRMFNSEYWNYAKLISGLLRHKMPVEYIIKVISSLSLDESNINTWKNGVIRTLRKCITSNETNADDLEEKCPECGTKLTRESGCLICKNCGYSKCG